MTDMTANTVLREVLNNYKNFEEYKKAVESGEVTVEDVLGDVEYLLEMFEYAETLTEGEE